MYQTHSNNTPNTTNNAMDCAESRTVRIINVKYKQQPKQQKLQNFNSCKYANDEYDNNISNSNSSCSGARLPTPAVMGRLSDERMMVCTANANFTNGITNNNNNKLTCQQLSTVNITNATAAASTNAAHKVIATTTSNSTVTRRLSRQSSGKKRSSHSNHNNKILALMKFYTLLPIICIAICAQVSYVVGRTLPERNLILHTIQSRVQQHNRLMHYQRESAPKYTEPPNRHHNINIRSLDMNCMDIARVLRSSKNQAEVSLQILKDNVHKYTFPRFNTTPKNATESWSLHRLHLSHPYQKVMDRNFTNEIVNHDFSHLQGKTLDEELLTVELNKIYKTIRMLQTAYTRLSEENNRNKLDLVRRYPGYTEMKNFLNVARLELNNNLQNTESTIRSLDIEMENFDENAVAFNETNSVKDWLMIVENISFLQYLNRLYALLLKMCKDAQ